MYPAPVAVFRIATETGRVSATQRYAFVMLKNGQPPSLTKYRQKTDGRWCDGPPRYAYRIGAHR
jgi:hypothetical protein